ncbi:MAG: alkaline phosphatase D family protein [Bdellovibrio bacteriovorus]
MANLVSGKVAPVISPDLPLVLAGPILRRLTPERLTLWLALREPVRARLELRCGEATPRVYPLDPNGSECRMLGAGAHLHYLLIDLPLGQPLPKDRWIGYALWLQPLGDGSAPWQGWSDWAPDLCYPGRDSPGFMLPGRIGALLHGSCRKPHHRGGDGLVQADRLLARCLAGAPEGPDPEAPDTLPAWPSLLVLTGDQIYADDVAGPMLRAIHRLIARLGLPVEILAGAGIGLTDAEALYRNGAGYYRRETLLPRHRRNYALIEILFGGVEKPIFTTASAHNHLITLAEVLAMYLLAWSPAPWQGLDLSPPPGLDPASRALYDAERPLIAAFVAELPAVRRLLAHLPVAMIFDDHDITDDWNLSREWEEIAYGHPLSKRVIGNALIGYLINQGWGNRPESFDAPLLDAVQQCLAAPGTADHDTCIDQLLRFGNWHYEWPTSPPLVAIDTRTHRWRSERAAREPSGLLDWEALTDLQQTLRGQPAVLLVSPAPIFGVKLIETLQRVFTWLGKPLLVDAENWMAHPGAAHAILNIFRHPKTPGHFVVLSGDVHYSFVYDVELRGRLRGPDIWQICSSGVRNEFPPRLLAVLDRANRWLYSPRSPLNWLTRRRHLRVVPRKPEGTPHGRRLLNGSGIGLVELDPTGVPWRIRELLADGRVIPFTRREAESRWD